MYGRLKSPMAAIAAAAALLAPIASHAAIVGFSLTIDDATNSVSSRLAGVSVTTLGVQQWRLDFTGSAVVRANFTVATGMTWLSGADDLGVNWLRQESGLIYLLDGDYIGGLPSLSCGGPSAPLAQGVTCAFGISAAQDDYYVTVIDPTPTAVSAPATLALSGLGLLGIAASRRRRAA